MFWSGVLIISTLLLFVRNLIGPRVTGWSAGITSEVTQDNR